MAGPFATARALHWCLWPIFQCCFWHVRSQYSTDLQLMHWAVAPLRPQLEQRLSGFACLLSVCFPRAFFFAIVAVARHWTGFNFWGLAAVDATALAVVLTRRRNLSPTFRAWVRVDDAVEMLLGDGVGDVESPPVGDAENTSELQPRCLFSIRPVENLKCGRGTQQVANWQSPTSSGHIALLGQHRVGHLRALQ